MELSVEKDPGGKKVVVADPLDYMAENADGLLHRINLFRELFGEASIATEDLEHFTRTTLRRLNWEVLPPGEMPWPQLSKRLRPILDTLGERKRPVAENRLKLFTEDFMPSLTATGKAGFSGYLVFGYEERRIFVVESLEYGNATYVFGEDWEQLSQLTKAEVLRGSLQRDRIIHREGWEQKVRDLLT